ncbi:hypothetical protein C8R43DRAFT_612538 [Mycena crocata]|nr:hypothetical protein C8R43DRAFT_612538 [Mycena crocata]
MLHACYLVRLVGYAPFVLFFLFPFFLSFLSILFKPSLRPISRKSTYPSGNFSIHNTVCSVSHFREGFELTHSAQMCLNRVTAEQEYSDVVHGARLLYLFGCILWTSVRILGSIPGYSRSFLCRPLAETHLYALPKIYVFLLKTSSQTTPPVPGSFS